MGKIKYLLIILLTSFVYAESDGYAQNDDIEILKRKTKTLERKAFPEAIVEIFRYN